MTEQQKVNKQNEENGKKIDKKSIFFFCSKKK